MKRKVLYMVVVLLGFLAPLRLCAQASYNVPANGNTSVHTCDAWIYDHAGPNSSYVNNCDGYMVIYPAVAGNMVSFVSGDYWIESSVYSGSPYDYVTIYNGVGLSGTVLAELYGTGSITTPITSTDPTGALTIRFVSDNSVVLGGFEFRVQCVYPIPMSDTPLSGCSFLWSDPVGTVGYNNQDLTQTICSDEGEPLSVLFSQFSLEPGDVLYVYDGNTTTAPLLGAFTGNSIPSNMISSGDCLTFYFERNSNSLNSSWVASINCVTCTPASTASGSPCAIDNIHPFCTGETQTTYYSGTTGNAKDFFGLSSGYLGCLGVAQAPAWYFMRIDDPGDMTIHIEQHSSTGTPLDVDFACWGPFAAASTEDFVQNLCCGYYSFNISFHPSNTGYYLDDGYNAWGAVPNYPFPNLVDCSYDPQTWEECHINSAQSGDYYLLLITNYSGYSSGSTGTISFSATEGEATTDCGIVAEVSNDGPYCVGDTIHLFCNDPQQGATYQWEGPGGWTSTAVNPVIYPATASMNGNTYTLVKTLNGVSSAPASTTIEVIPVNTYISVNPPTASICRGSSATLVGSSVTGYQNSYSWSTGQHNQQITVSPTTTTTYSLTQTVAGRCTGHATVTVNVHYPQHQSYYVDTCANSYSWHNHSFAQAGIYTRTWSHQDANGCTQVDTLHLTMHSPSFTPPVDVNKQVPCSQNIHIPQQLPVITSCDNNVPLQLYDSINNIQNGCGYYRYVYHYTVGETQYTWNYTYYLQPPSTFSPPSNQSSQVQCLDDAVAPVPPVVVNACGDTIVPEAQAVVNNVDNCSGNVVYSWLYKDCLNHSKTWKYTYVVEDTTRPSFTVPADTYICWTLDGTYNADPDITGQPSDLDDNCSSSQDLTVDYEDILHVSTHGADTLIRTWVVTDACDNARSQQQRVLVYHPDTTSAWEYICEGELFEERGFSFVAYHDTLVYQHLQSGQTGCDSVVKVVLSVWHPEPTSDSVVAFDQYLWNDSLYIQGGTYLHSHLDGNGCTQVDTLYLTLYFSSHTDIYDTACLEYSWYGNEYTRSGEYEHLLHDMHGADSLLILHLTILGKDEVEFFKQRCFGYMWHDHYYDATGDYTLVLSNRYGCDSVVTMHLSIQDTIYEDFEDEACNSYTWNDKTYYSTGDFEQIFNVFEGCDSLVTLHLTLYYDDTVSVDTFACESYTWNDSIYTHTGNYEQHFFTEHGCDSLVQLNLTIYHKTYSDLDSAICAADFPFQWNGVTFNMPGGTDSTIIPNVMGCDSMITMHVTMNPNTSSVLHDTIVQNALPYDTLGMHFTTAGRKQTTISNVYGCDSMVTMILTVLPNVQIDLDSTVCENYLPLRWNGLTFTQAGTQNVTLIATTKVDSTIVMHLNVNPNTYSTVLDTVIENDLPHTFNGVVFADSVTNASVVIPNAQGCDSIITYSLHVWWNSNNTVDSAVCDDQLPVMWNGVEFTAADESQIVLTGAHGEDDTLLMRLHVNTSAHTSLSEEICMSDFPYRYVNGQIDTTFQSGTPSLLTVSYTLSTVNGCDSIVTLTLDVMDTSLKIISSDDFCQGMFTTLTVETSLEDYVWSTGETSSSIEVTEPGEYSVTAYTGDCRGRAFRKIYPCKMELRMPNAISPSNYDGLNDCFQLPEACLEQIESFEIKIFSRWGEMVFYSTDKNFRWYGEYKGHLEREEVFSYTIKYIDRDGIMNRMKGAITVL